MNNLKNNEIKNASNTVKLLVTVRIFPRLDGDEENPDYYEDFLNELGLLLYETNLIVKSEPEFISDDLVLEAETATFREYTAWNDLTITPDDDITFRNWLNSSPEKWAVEEICYIDSGGKRVDPPWAVGRYGCETGNIVNSTDLIDDYLAYADMMNKEESLVV